MKSSRMRGSATTESGPNRRAFLRAAGVTMIGGALLTRGAFLRAATGGSATESIAQTRSGKIRGSHDGKAHVFKGVPYGAPTSGENRFMAPRKPQSWSGVRDALHLGNQSPQLSPVIMAEELVAQDNSPFSEDCLYLNVWTPALRDGRRRPVMVWFHGGGYTNGSGGDAAYDGSNLAHKHDVVVVTVNERLNAFGFLYLAELGGERYADSGNAGLLDLIAALQWVRDNIEEFGGDPGNVTIFGQSGGGDKVSTLMATPAAKGLFHRAICQSGLAMKGAAAAAATEMARKVMAALNLQPNEVNRLQQVPVADMLAALNFVSSQGGGPGGLLPFGPVVDHRTLNRDPWTPDAPAEHATVPMLIGSTLTEGTFLFFTPRDPMNDLQLRAQVQHGLGFGAIKLTPEQADELIALYRRGYPQATNTRLFQIMTGDNWMIPSVTRVAELKSAQKGASVFVYHWEWITPVEQGRLGAPHTGEIPFAFDNVDVPVAELITGTGADRFAMADKTSSAWVAFARTGNPSHSGLPKWEPYSADHRAVMILDRESRLLVDPHPEQREAVTRLAQGPA